MGREKPVRFRFSLRLCFLLVLLASVLFAWIYWLRLLPQKRPGRDVSTHPDGWYREAELRDIYADYGEWFNDDKRNFIRDADIEEVSRYRTLKILQISSQFATDEGIAHLADLQNLEHLEIRAKNMTDKGLRHLHGLNKLETLRVNWCTVTRDGVQKLHDALPNCKIEWNGSSFP
jgi:hypothetical protein